MNYYDLSKNFWNLYRDKAFGHVDTAVYFYLLNECNIRRWLNPFELQTRNLEIMLGISRKTIVEARNRLKQRGVIDFLDGKGSGAAIYKIVGLEVTNETLKNKFCVSDCVSSAKHKGNTNGNTNGNTKVTQTETQTENTPIIVKDRRHKTKDSIASCDADNADATLQKSLFDEEDKKQKKRKSTKSKAPPIPGPTFEEVREYFLSQDADVRLENWEESCRSFYDNFNAVDWRDKFNRRITRWDSRANKWILDDEKQQKERHETKRNTRPDAPTDDRRQGQFDIADYISRKLSPREEQSGGFDIDKLV